MHFQVALFVAANNSTFDHAYNISLIQQCPFYPDDGKKAALLHTEIYLFNKKCQYLSC